DEVGEPARLNGDPPKVPAKITQQPTRLPGTSRSPPKQVSPRQRIESNFRPGFLWLGPPLVSGALQGRQARSRRRLWRPWTSKAASDVLAGTVAFQANPDTTVLTPLALLDGNHLVRPLVGPLSATQKRGLHAPPDGSSALIALDDAWATLILSWLLVSLTANLWRPPCQAPASSLYVFPDSICEWLGDYPQICTYWDPAHRVPSCPEHLRRTVMSIWGGKREGEDKREGGQSGGRDRLRQIEQIQNGHAEEGVWRRALQPAGSSRGRPAGQRIPDQRVRGVHIHHPHRLPVLFNSKDKDKLMKPAVSGTVAIMKAARKCGVTKVVITSSTAATVAGHKDRTQGQLEDNTGAYFKSKTLAEKAAWDFVKDLPEEEKFGLVTINPVTAMGPTLTGGYRTLSQSTLAVLRDDADGNHFILCAETVYLIKLSECLVQTYGLW
ncbi:hypothetical protein THAOC_23392, partial [Thalassiosira oceanica]